MQFITLQFFLFFLAVFFVAILLKESKKYYKVFLLVASLLFYFSFGVNFFLILCANIIINYLFLVLINKSENDSDKSKKILLSAVIVNVLFLAAFKYYNFGTDTLLQTLNALHIPANIQVLRVIIPVGVSFYTFRNISHLIDLYRREIHLPSFVEFANYVAFFPQIMSGPITRAKEFYSYLNNPTLLSYSQGRIITLILSGLIKKYVIASYLFDFVSAPFATPTNYARTDLVLAAFAYSILLYVDFSGYSDFAIAISNLLGFNVEANFNKPYSSIGLKDFWNRWHISLSLWFKDYVYIPLGGSRKGKLRKYWNIMVTMFISGLWHGAGWNFIIWGILHGVGSVVSHIVADFFGVKESSKMTHSVNEMSLHSERMVNHDFHAIEVPFYKRVVLFIMKFIGWAITYIYITFAWIFFNSANLGNAVNFIVAMFSSNVVELKTYDIRAVGVIVIVLLSNFLGDKIFKNISRFFDSIPLVIRIPFVTVIVYLILQLGPTTMPPFIYFNF